jgi:hypothetical protein
MHNGYGAQASRYGLNDRTQFGPPSTLPNPARLGAAPFVKTLPLAPGSYLCAIELPILSKIATVLRAGKALCITAKID